MKYSNLFVICCLAILSNIGVWSSDLATVSYVDLQKYIGTWYEIAKLPNRFQRQCAGYTTATYELRSNGDIKVTNQCTKHNGRVTRSTGRAWITDFNTNAKLKVSFVPIFKNLRMFGGKYWILDLDEKYQYVMVGNPNRKYLWILARSRTLDKTIYKKLLNKAQSMGFDVNFMVKTVQD